MPNYEIPSGNEPTKNSEPIKEVIEKEQPEKIPTKEEVIELIKRLIGETEYEEVRELKDEQGLYMLEIRIPDEDGGSNEYSYIRAGNYRDRGLVGGCPPETAIHFIYIDNEGFPCKGNSVFKLVDGEWKYNPWNSEKKSSTEILENIRYGDK